MRKLAVSFCLLLTGLSIFVLSNPYYTVFPTNGNLVYYVTLTILYLAMAVALKRSRSLARYGPAAYGLFIASAATLFLGTGLLNIRAATTDPVLAKARDKVNDFCTWFRSSSPLPWWPRTTSNRYSSPGGN